MKQRITICTIILVLSSKNLCYGQNEINKEKLMKEVTDVACNCIDSISVYNKSRDAVSKEINECINKQVIAFQITEELGSTLDELKDTKKRKHKNKENKIFINTNPNSEEYKKYYYKIERALMDNCEALKKVAAANDKQSNNSLTKDKTALEFYNKGLNESEKGNYQNAIVAYKVSLKYDSKNAFAWDNLGICYRKLEQYDEAIKAYQQSISLDSNSETPIMNLAVVYRYQKEYMKSIEMYNRLTRITPDNPEIFYGIGLIYAMDLKNYEVGLDNLCKSYNIYIKQNSPYRTDAERIINMVYKEMKENKQENKFYEILKKNGINAKD